MVLHSYICMLVLVHKISVHHSFTTELVIKRSNNKKSCSKSLLVIQASVYHCSEKDQLQVANISQHSYTKHYHNAWIVQVFTLILFILIKPLYYPYSQMISLVKGRQNLKLKFKTCTICMQQYQSGFGNSTSFWKNIKNINKQILLCCHPVSPSAHWLK